jgi:SpoVK/Ycf46/Vps4 family AAA+-type ATPase
MRQDFSTWTMILDIVRAALAHETDAVRDAALKLAERVEHPDTGAGEPQIGKLIRRIVAESTSQSGGLGTAGPAHPTGGAMTPAKLGGASGPSLTFGGGFGPVDGESRSPFVDELTPTTNERLILPEAATSELERFVELRRNQDAMARAGLLPPRTLLLYGPPGSGKSTAARTVAAALSLPLLTVRLDAVISSYLGTTAKNLRAVFDYAAYRRGVLFLDEFDALAKMRDDAHEVGEIKRIVNGLIQNLDGYPEMPLIAATNHEHLLDPAIWRRFDSIVALQLPGRDEREALLRLFIERTYPTSSAGGAYGVHERGMSPRRTMRAASARPALQPVPTSAYVRSLSGQADPALDSEELGALAQLTEGCSGADLERTVVRARQEALLDDLRAGQQARPRGSLAEQIVLEIWRAHQPGTPQATFEHATSTLRPALVDFIDRRTHMRLSARVVSVLTGIPASTVARLRQQHERSVEDLTAERREEDKTP